ncbi:MAG: right-handed parallel beta-helix repeat-containing protein [Planctomycetota bacterium]
MYVSTYWAKAGLAGALCVSTLARADGIFFVRADLSTGANNGSSWADAFRGGPGLQTALAAAPPGTQIWVGTGTYKPTSPGGSRLVSFVLPSGVGVYGGFAGTESSLQQRDVNAHVTILSGDLNANDAPGEPGPDNSAHVVRATNVGATSRLDGVTIRAGSATDHSQGNVVDREHGGGMLLVNASPTIAWCTFEGNTASWAGSGLMIDGGSPTISHCRFTANSCPYFGAGLAAAGNSHPSIEDCLFDANIGSQGVGIYTGPVVGLGSATAHPTVRRCEFRDNLGWFGATSGGGLLCSDGTSLIEDCLFLGNFANGGGGAFFASGHATLSRCTFIDNSSNGDLGDAIYLQAAQNDLSPTLDIVNCQITGHPSSLSPNRREGSPILLNAGTTRIVNCTIADNGGPTSAGAILSLSGSLRIDNSILWGNTGFQGSGQNAAIYHSNFGNPSVQVNSSLVQGWNGSLPGTGNFAAPPLFSDPDGPDNIARTADDDYRLSSGSPAIDRASNPLVPAGTSTDLAGRPRFRQDPLTPDLGVGPAPIIDCGAFEFQAPCPADFDGDGVVDFFDYDTFVTCFEGIACPPGKTADFDSDSAVDFFDYDAFVLAFELGC